MTEHIGMHMSNRLIVSYLTLMDSVSADRGGSMEITVFLMEYSNSAANTRIIRDR